MPPGEDVLGVNLRVAELYINAPDLPTAGNVRSYTMSFGAMTMIADLERFRHRRHRHAHPGSQRGP